MADKYELLNKKVVRLYAEGSPLIIETTAVTKELDTGNIIGQVKFKSVSEKKINAVVFNMMAYDVLENELESVFGVQCLDMSVEKGEYFGHKLPVYLPNKITRKVSVEIQGVAFCDGTMWKGSDLKWEELSEQQEKERFFKEEHEKMNCMLEAQGNELIRGNSEQNQRIEGEEFLTTLDETSERIIGNDEKVEGMSEYVDEVENFTLTSSNGMLLRNFKHGCVRTNIVLEKDRVLLLIKPKSLNNITEMYYDEIDFIYKQKRISFYGLVWSVVSAVAGVLHMPVYFGLIPVFVWLGMNDKITIYLKNGNYTRFYSKDKAQNIKVIMSIEQRMKYCEGKTKEIKEP